MTESEPQSLDLQGKMHFHLVLADVIYETKRGGVASMRTQFMTQSPVNEFCAARIHQLQNSAAHTIREKLGPGRAEGFKIHDVLFLNFMYAGFLTQEEFYGKGMTAEADLKEADASSPSEPTVADGETASGDNVVPMNRNN